jgi:hypothetical protein
MSQLLFPLRLPVPAVASVFPVDTSACHRALTFFLAVFFLTHLCHAQDAVFDGAPAHPWNRLRKQLFSRPMPDGAFYAEEGLEPLLVPRSRFLMEGMSHADAIAALDLFLADDADCLIQDPLKRAILQRDLWSIFVTTADPALGRQPQRRALQRRLVAVMRRVALNAEQISRLPDNYAATVRSGRLAASFDASAPEQPFLPPDLLEPEGPWVLLGDRWGWKGNSLAAPAHFEATQGRSLFLILLRLPGGRETTLRYLASIEQLRVGRDEIPQIPPGTQVALLRRMMLIDDRGTLRPTPITESLQLRVYEQLNAPRMFEFTLRRKELFADGGGLHAVSAEEINYFDVGSTVLSPRSNHDPFESPRFFEERDYRVLSTCVKCHAGPGVFGFQSMFHPIYDYPVMTAEEQLPDQVEFTRAEAQRGYAWGLLQGLWSANVTP